MDTLSGLVRLQPALNDLALLLARVVFGGFMLVGHGWGKLQLVGTDAGSKFPDPLGIGATASLVGALAGEVLCAALIVVGLFTRIGALGMAFTMGVAALVVHAGDPLFMGAGASKEPALLYMAGAVVIALAGPGRLSIDQLIKRRVLRHEPAPPPTAR